MFDSLQPLGAQPARLLSSWNSPGKNTGVCSHSLLQGIFLTQGLNMSLLHCRQILYYLSHFHSVQFSSVTQSCPPLWDPMNRSMPSLPVHHQLRSSLRLTSIESVMPSSHLILCCPLLLLPPIPPQQQSLFQWVNSLHEVAKVLEFQL